MPFKSSLSFTAAEEKEKDEETKIESLPTGDSSVPPKSEEVHKDLGEQAPSTICPPTTSVSKGEEELFAAIRSLQGPYIVDPLARHDFDSFIVETFQRQHRVHNNKKSLHHNGPTAASNKTSS